MGLASGDLRQRLSTDAVSCAAPTQQRRAGQSKVTTGDKCLSSTVNEKYNAPIVIKAKKRATTNQITHIGNTKIPRHTAELSVRYADMGDVLPTSKVCFSFACTTSRKVFKALGVNKI